jgi:predicted ferric reductase
LPPFRRLSYELFLRSHQALALAALYAVWRHVPSDTPSLRYYFYICIAIPTAMFLLQSMVIIIRNGVFSHHLARATISHDEGAVKMQLHLTRPLKVEAGRYINLWIPSVSFWSFLQTHPFTVVSWTATAQDTLDLLIEPRRGLTRELLDHAKRGYTLNPMVMFSGPHGMGLAMDKYESVLMVASGFGIAALLPYMKKLIYDYNARMGRARRIHVVWQISNRGRLIILEPV